MKKSGLLMMIVFFCTFCFIAQAQQKGAEDVWAKKRSEYYKKELTLTDGQTDKIYEVLFVSAKEANDIKETIDGDALKKALWRNGQKRNNDILKILTPQQANDLKKLWSGEFRRENNRQQESVEQKEDSSNDVPTKWVKQRTQQYRKELGLTDEQTDKVYEELLAAEKRAKEIKETITGDAQKKALRQNGKERNDRIFEILTPQQIDDLKKLWGREASK